MKSRSISLRCPADAVDELVTFIRDEVLPTVSGMSGNRGLTLLVGSGRCTVTTFWDTEEAVAASRDYFGTARDRMVEISGDPSPEVAAWDAAVVDVRNPAPAGAGTAG